LKASEERERETSGPIGDNPLLKHIDGGGG